MYDALIIGGGSAGLMCASRLIYMSNKIKASIRIGIIDSNSRVGKKLAITGNGKCNITSTELHIDNYLSDDIDMVSRIIECFDSRDTLEFFENILGLSTTNVDELVYPITNRSNTVLDAFRFYLEEHGVEFILNRKIANILDNGDCFCLYSEDTNAEVFKSTRVVIATGGASYPKTGSDGNGYRLLSSFVSQSQFTQIKPSLVQLTIRDNDLKQLSGNRFDVKVSLIENNNLSKEEQGQLLFTEDGVSGICIMQLSRYVRKGRYHLSVDFAPRISTDDLLTRIRTLLQTFPNRIISASLCGLFSRNLIEIILRRLSISSSTYSSELTDSDIVKLCKALKNLRIQISGLGDFDNAQVTSGGLNLSAVNENLELIAKPGIYVCGEILNVDGPCGGYNLQWAWSSANAVAKAIMENDNDI